MRSTLPFICLSSALLLAAANTALCAEPAPSADVQKLARQVADTERAFARTMANRDFPAFTSFIADEAIFFSGPTATRGRQQVADSWKRYFDEPTAPFSWGPQQVEVLDSGRLALSTGPVYDPRGKLIGTFTSIWRQEAPGTWRIVFDKGCDVCQVCGR